MEHDFTNHNHTGAGDLQANITFPNASQAYVWDSPGYALCSNWIASSKERWLNSVCTVLIALAHSYVDSATKVPHIYNREGWGKNTNEG